VRKPSRVVQKPVGKPKPVGTPKVTKKPAPAKPALKKPTPVRPTPVRPTPVKPPTNIYSKRPGMPEIGFPAIPSPGAPRRINPGPTPPPSGGATGGTFFKSAFGGIDSNMLAPSGGAPGNPTGFKLPPGPRPVLQGMKKGGSVAKPGLYANIHAKKKRIAAGSGEKMRKVGSKGAPSKMDFIKSAKTAKRGR
jgi:hypothetical protein